MDNEFASHELNYIRRYEALGFTDQFRIIENELENLQSKKRHAPKDVIIVKEHRYEGMSNPSDMSILYVIKTNDGAKGTVLASYGANADTAVNEFMNMVPEENQKDDIMFPPDANQ